MTQGSIDIGNNKAVISQNETYRTCTQEVHYQHALENIEHYINDTFSTLNDLKKLDNSLKEVESILTLQKKVKKVLIENNKEKETEISHALESLEILLNTESINEDEFMMRWLTFDMLEKLEFHESGENVEIHTEGATESKNLNPTQNIQNHWKSIYPHLFLILVKLDEIDANLYPVVDQIINNYILPIAETLKETMYARLMEKNWGSVPLNVSRNIDDKNVFQEASLELDSSDFETLEQLYMLQILTWNIENLSNCNESRFQYLWFIEILLQPILLRFDYFFQGNRKTNQIGNSEFVTSFFETMNEYYVPVLVKIGTDILSLVHTEHNDFLEALSLDVIDFEKVSSDMFKLLLSPASERFLHQLQILSQTEKSDESKILVEKIIQSITDIDSFMMKSSNNFSILRYIFSKDEFLLEWIADIDREAVWEPIEKMELDLKPTPLRATEYGVVPTISTFTFIDSLERFKSRLTYIDNKELYAKRTYTIVLEDYLHLIEEVDSLPDLLNAPKSQPVSEDDVESWRCFCRRINSIMYIIQNIQIWNQLEFMYNNGHVGEQKFLSEIRGQYEETHYELLTLLTNELISHFTRSLTDYSNSIYILDTKSMIGSNMTLPMYNLATKLLNLWSLIQEELNLQDFDLILEKFSRNLDTVLYQNYISENESPDEVVSKDLIGLISSMSEIGTIESYFSSTLKGCKKEIEEFAPELVDLC